MGPVWNFMYYHYYYGGFNSHPGQSFPLSLCGPNSISRAHAHMVHGLKHQHFTLHPITLFVLNTSATRPYVAKTT